MLVGVLECMTPRCCSGSCGEQLSESPVFSNWVKVDIFCIEPFQMFSDHFEDGVTGSEPVGVVVLFLIDSRWPTTVRVKHLQRFDFPPTPLLCVSGCFFWFSGSVDMNYGPVVSPAQRRQNRQQP